MAEKKKKTGIMGGTFNPIHIGHLLLAESARDSFALDEILFIPSGCSYMKNAEEVADKRMRLEMTRLAIADNPFFTLSETETVREGSSYTCDTLSLLKAQEPDTEFFFIVGADSLFSMESWKNPGSIFSLCTVLAAVRDGKDQEALGVQIQYLERKFGAHIEQIRFQEIAVSSTDIRRRISRNQSVRYMVPDRVISYIEAHHLYAEE